MTFYSPLRYPGGKARLANYFKKLISDNGLQGGTYVEIYAGGASIALSLLIEGYVSEAVINDKDKSIFAVWKSILEYPEEVCTLIRKTPLNIKNWKLQKEIQKKKSEYNLNNKKNLLKLGFSTLFLNRTNRSGIIGAGVIGGLKQKGLWKINSRFDKKDIIARIKLISQYKDKIKVYNEDAAQLMLFIKHALPEKTLIYLDPPYYVKGKELYMNYYDYKDHKNISKIIKKITGAKWVLTYDNVPVINELYKGFDNYTYLLNYSAANSGRGEEVIIFSKNIKHSPEGLTLANH